MDRPGGTAISRNCALLVQAHDLAIEYGQFGIRYASTDVLGQVRERCELVAIAGDQLNTVMLDDGQGTEAVVF
jgi:hypothetical protein